MQNIEEIQKHRKSNIDIFYRNLLRLHYYYKIHAARFIKFFCIFGSASFILNMLIIFKMTCIIKDSHRTVDHSQLFKVNPLLFIAVIMLMSYGFTYSVGLGQFHLTLTLYCLLFGLFYHYFILEVTD